MGHAFKISEAASLAIHAVSIIAKQETSAPIKLSSLARTLDASVTHLGKVMHRLVASHVVTSRRGPLGGFTLGKRAGTMTLLDVQEIFDGPLSCDTCLLGKRACPFGECVLGNTPSSVDNTVRRELGTRRIIDIR